MLQTPHELRFQAVLLILFSCGVFIGVVSLAVDAFPFFVIPERLMLAPAGVPAVILTGLAVLALTFEQRHWRILAGILLGALGGYGLVMSVLAKESGGPLFWQASATFSPLPLVPSILVLMMAGVSVLGLDNTKAKLFGFIIGCTGVGAGAVILSLHLNQGLDPDADGIVGGFSVLCGVFTAGFSAALVILSRRQAPIRFTLGRNNIACALLGVSGTFVLSIMASWGVHADRHLSAKNTLQQVASVLEHELDAHGKLIERLAHRWAVFSYEVPAELKRIEVGLYFSDIPALDAVMLMNSQEDPVWRTSRSGSDLFWLTDQLAKPEVLDWIREVRERDLSSAWLFPDSALPFNALAVVKSSHPASHQFLAVFDLQVLLRSEFPHPGHELDIRLLPAGVTSPAPGSRNERGKPEILETATVDIPNGGSVVLSARAGPPELWSFRGLFPVALLVFGLVMSYLLVAGRSFLGAYRLKARELRTAEQEFRSLFSQSADAIFASDRNGHFRSLNSVARLIVGLNDSDVGVTHYLDVLEAGMMSERDQNVFAASFREAVAGTTQSFEVRFTSPDSHDTRDYECDLLPIVVDGEVTGVFIMAKDITERLQAQENQRILERSLESSDNGVVVVDLRPGNLPVVYINPAFSQMTGYSPSEVLGAPVNFLMGPETADADIDLVRDAVRAGRPLSLTLKSYRRDGTPFWNQVSLAPVRDDSHQVTHYAAIMRDISEKREQEKRLAYQATHDVLTGLGNRALFEDHLAHDLSLAKRKDQLLAVLFIDLDEFKPINDTLGHKIGDELLVSVARRLERISRQTDTLVRFGGDEFVLLLPDLASAHEAEEVAERILEELAKPHLIGTHELYISASIGISILAEGLDHPEKLLQQADMAMYKAKLQGRDTYEIFSQDLDSAVSKRVILRNDLQEAIKSNQLFLHYQPQVDQAGTLCGLEALVRWKHPKKGFISPVDFIPIAEETGQIVQLGKWVTTQACRDARILMEKGLLRGRMAVNLSPLQFHRPGFLDNVAKILDKTGLPAQYLELELTEGILMKDTDGAIDILNELSRMGIATAIDDFGTGFSSFSYLRDLPVTKIKIDRSFVSSIAISEKDAAVCKGVITLAREMDLRVIAEGVETREQVETLSRNGCEAFQGYYFARPMAFDDLINWLAVEPSTA